MAKIGLPKGSGKRLKVREKSVKSQGILKWILSGNPCNANHTTKQTTVLRIFKLKHHVQTASVSFEPVHEISNNVAF